ncbi:hypothetical protein [Brevibacterium senegalense]|uniref:hypothetical protein n=1 Tax=Brevibacterium senegalense TaxID=1033736 RepID=UPI000362C8AD|nr:hypothetical protein [Brevibacterium senegalense]
MSTDIACPPPAEVGEIVPEAAYGAFVAGWSAGTARRTTQPASQDLIEQVATMLDAASVADALTRPE